MGKYDVRFIGMVIVRAVGNDPGDCAKGECEAAAVCQDLGARPTSVRLDN